MIDEKDVSIIIPTILTSPKNVIYECIKSLRETTKAQIVVVYNGAFIHDIGIWDSEVRPDKEIQLFEQGQSKACNAGVAIVNTPWVLITNDDMMYGPDWLQRLTEGMEGRLCVSPNLVEPRRGAPPFIEYFCGGAGGDFNKDKWLIFAKDYKSGDIWENGFNLPFLINRELFNLIGQYDIKMDPWGSNGDSCLQTRIELAGVKPQRNRNSVVYHFSQTSGTFHPDNRAFWDKNWHYYIEKYGFPRADSPAIWYSDNIIQWDKLKFKPWWKDIYKKNA